jgi:hypothetical protein
MESRFDNRLKLIEEASAAKWVELNSHLAAAVANSSSLTSRLDTSVRKFEALRSELNERLEGADTNASISTLTCDLAEVKAQLDGFAAEVSRLQASSPANPPLVLDSQSQAILGAVGKLEDRFHAMGAHICVVEAHCVPEHTNVSRGDGSIAKPCRYYPNCRLGSSCRYQHLARDSAPSESEVDMEEMARFESIMCEGCGFLPWDGCASSCPVFQAQQEDQKEDQQVSPQTNSSSSEKHHQSSVACDTPSKPARHK